MKNTATLTLIACRWHNWKDILLPEGGKYFLWLAAGCWTMVLPININVIPENEPIIAHFALYGLSKITWWTESGTRTSFSQEGRWRATCRPHPLRCRLWAPTTERQAAPSPQRQPPPSCPDQVSWKPQIVLRKSLTKNTEILFICNHLFIPLPVGNPRRQDLIGGGVHTSEVIMRKRSENRGYTDEHIRDSIVMGDMSSKFPNLGMFASGVWGLLCRAAFVTMPIYDKSVVQVHESESLNVC